MKTKNQLLSKALDLTNKEWREKHSELGSFPRRIASPGEIKSISQFTNKADAEKELKSLLAQDEQEEEEENLSSAEKQLLLWRDQLNALLSIGSRTTEQQNHVANLQTSITTLEQHLAKKQAKNDARDEKLAVAREIFKTKLHQLLVGKQKAKADDKKM